MARYISVALEVLILLLILFVPLAFAGTTYWAWTVMELCVALGLVLWLLQAIVQQRLCIVRTPLNVLAVLLVLFVFLQLVPLPAGLVSRLSHDRVALQVTGNPTADLSQAAAAPSRVPLSIYRWGTLQSFFRLLAYVGFFFLLINFLHTRARIARVLAVVVLAGIVVALGGLTTMNQNQARMYRLFPTGDDLESPPSINARIPDQMSAGYGYAVSQTAVRGVEWFRFKAKAGDVFGSFPQTNQAAGFLVMIIPVALGVMFAFLSTRRAEWGQAGGLLYSTEGNMVLLMLVVLASLLLGLVMTRSRGGLIVGIGALIVTFVLAGFAGSWRRGLVTAVVLAVFILVPVLVIGHLQLTGTVRETLNLALNPWSNDRVRFWSAAEKIAADFPLVGTGVGTFKQIYPLYSTGGPQAYYAHNDWLQWRVEGGSLGMILAGVTGVVYAVIVIVGLVRMRDRPMRRLLLGTFLGSLAVLAHASIDFDFAIPATAFTFTVLASVSVVLAQDRMSRQEDQDFVFQGGV